MSKEIITPEAFISYPNLFVADDKGKYGCALIFVEGVDLKELKDAAAAVAFEEFGDKAAGMFASGQLYNPFRTDVESKPGYPAGATFFNTRTNNKPGVVAAWADPSGETGADGKLKPAIITDPSIIIAGGTVKALVNPYYFDVDGNKGVTFGLNGIQWIRKPTAEERLDGRIAAVDAFAVDLDAVEDLSDLESDDEEVPGPTPVAAGAGAVDDLSDLL